MNTNLKNVRSSNPFWMYLSGLACLSITTILSDMLIPEGFIGNVWMPLVAGILLLGLLLQLSGHRILLLVVVTTILYTMLLTMAWGLVEFNSGESLPIRLMVAGLGLLIINSTYILVVELTIQGYGSKMSHRGALISGLASLPIPLLFLWGPLAVWGTGDVFGILSCPHYLWALVFVL